jgi:hypothetical protein
MSRSTVRAILVLAASIPPLAIVAAACSRPAEQQFLTQFFRASRARDNTTVAMMSAVEFDPREQGEVVDFDITTIGPEQRTRLDLKTLVEAERKAVAEQEDFRKRRVEFETANRPALVEIATLEKSKGRFTAAQQKLKAEWDRWREDALTRQKAVSNARAALNAATGPAESSLAQPGMAAFAAEKFEGELVSKDVTLSAEVRAPDGQRSQRTLVVTIQRVEGTLDGVQRVGRPIITRIQGV